jgi:hypothetical protein
MKLNELLLESDEDGSALDYFEDIEQVDSGSGGIYLVPNDVKIVRFDDPGQRLDPKDTQWLQVKKALEDKEDLCTFPLYYRPKQQVVAFCKASAVKTVVNYLQQHITTDYGDKEEAAEMIAEIMAGSHVKALSAGTQQKLKGFLKKLEYAEEWYELKVTEGTLLVGAQDD